MWPFPVWNVAVRGIGGRTDSSCCIADSVPSLAVWNCHFIGGPPGSRSRHLGVRQSGQLGLHRSTLPQLGDGGSFRRVHGSAPNVIPWATALAANSRQDSFACCNATVSPRRRKRQAKDRSPLPRTNPWGTPGDTPSGRPIPFETSPLSRTMAADGDPNAATVESTDHGSG
jgi:hypothetical protein